MRRIDLMRERNIITAEELEFSAKLVTWLDRREAAWLAKHMRRGRPATKEEQQDFAMWQSSAEEQEWERFYGVADEAE